MLFVGSIAGFVMNITITVVISDLDHIRRLSISIEAEKRKINRKQIIEGTTAYLVRNKEFPFYVFAKTPPGLIFIY